MATNSFKTIEAAFFWLESFTNFERRTPMSSEYRLDRMAAMLADFSNPQLSIPCIHIAGSKGKGSTTHFCAQILHAAGYRVGIYASPHLLDYRERICGPAGFFPDNAYISVISQIKNYVDGLGIRPNWGHGEPTTFELLTLAAYLIFKMQKIEWMVVETGLGGRLDATNLMQPAACLITPIELEHTELLGNTLQAIAGEKAGIFKPGAILHSQQQNPEVAEVLDIVAAKMGQAIEYSETANSYYIDENGTAQVILNLATQEAGWFQLRGQLQILGSFQADNASQAAATICRLFDAGLISRISNHEMLLYCIKTGIATANPPGRLERWMHPDGSRFILDAAHTPRSVSMACEAFQPCPDDILLFGSVDGKRFLEMADILASKFSHIIITTPGTFKKSDPTMVFSAFHDLNPKTLLVIDPIEAFNACSEHLRQNYKRRMLICGSFYLGGAVISHARSTGWLPQTISIKE